MHLKQPNYNSSSNVVADPKFGYATQNSSSYPAPNNSRLLQPTGQYGSQKSQSNSYAMNSYGGAPAAPAQRAAPAQQNGDHGSGAGAQNLQNLQNMAYMYSLWMQNQPGGNKPQQAPPPPPPGKLTNPPPPPTANYNYQYR